MEQITTRSQSWNFTSRHITLMLWPTVVMPPKDVSPWVLGTDNTQSILSTRVAIFICYLKVLPLHFSDANDMLISNILPFFSKSGKDVCVAGRWILIFANFGNIRLTVRRSAPRSSRHLVKQDFVYFLHFVVLTIMLFWNSLRTTPFLYLYIFIGYA